MKIFSRKVLIFYSQRGGSNEYPQSMFWSKNKKMSLCVRKPTTCMGENKDADQLRGNREADQRLCVRYSDSTIPLLLKSEISSF